MLIIDSDMINPCSRKGIIYDSEPIALCNIASGTIPTEDIIDDLMGAYEKEFKDDSAFCYCAFWNIPLYASSSDS